MKGRLTVILVIAVATSLGVASVAGAHVLPAKIAQKGANKFGKEVAQQYVDENPNRSPASFEVDPCKRKSDHKFVCKLHVFGTDSGTGQAYDCHAYIRVTASKSSFSYNAKLTGQQPC